MENGFEYRRFEEKREFGSEAFPAPKPKIKRVRRKSAREIAAEACGLVKVRVNGKVFYE